MKAIHLYRVERWLLLRRVPLLPRAIYYLIFLLFNSVVPAEAEIGEDTQFGYGGMGVVLHKRSRIGARVMIGPQVTIGGRSGLWEVPVVEDDVYIGTGAKLLGPIRVGSGSTIGANAVVIHDVPPGVSVAGVPARVVGSSSGGSQAAAADQ